MIGAGHHLTPTQIASHERSKAFRAKIAEAAARVVVPPSRVKFIPNAPFGELKIAPAIEVPAPLPIPPEQPTTTRSQFWFYIDEQRGRPSIATIQRVVCEYFKLSHTQLLSRRRTHNISRPRQLAMYLCSTLTPCSMPEIGRRFGGMDHTTVLHAVRRMSEMTRKDASWAGHFSALSKILERQS